MTRNNLPDEIARRLARPLRLTLAGLWAERIARAFWSLATVAMTLAALLLSGGLAIWPDWIGQGGLVLLALLGLAALVHGIRSFRPPTRAEALARLDATLPGAPIAALTDTQAIGAEDPASAAVWAAHRAREAARIIGLHAPGPNPGLPRRDPFALRLAAATALAVALIFGAGTERGDLAALMPGSAEAALSQASWEGWIEPPSYTGKPTLYLADQSPGPLEVPIGARVTLRLYGKIAEIDIAETFSDAAPQEPTATRLFKIDGDGRLSIGNDSWDIVAIPDATPRIQASGDLTRTLDGEMRLPFTARDDYGVSAGQARIALDLPRVDRRHGLAPLPEPRNPITVDLPMPYRGDRSEIEELLVDNLAEHPWAELAVTVTLRATDAAGQTGESAPIEIVLPGRRFLHPLARAIVEQRRDILWTIENAPRAARILRAVSNRPDGLFAKETQYLQLRAAVSALEEDDLTAEARDETAAALWQIAVEIEDGSLADALERLRRARERLSEAMRQGATPEELAELMQDYRDAMRDYMRELAQRDPENRADEPDQGERMEMTQQDLQELMDRIEDLMEQGRMEEAQALLDMLQQMMENMEMTEGASGQQGQSPGEKAMEGLAETLRDQRGLSDEAFRNLQEQMNPGGGPGEGERQDGGAGEGESDNGENRPGPGEEGESGDGTGQSLADRQRALEDELSRQKSNLPGAGTPEGEAAREALDRAGRAMDQAADALEQGDTPGALDRQAEAMEELREGMRNLEDAMRREAQAGQSGQQGRLAGDPSDSDRADPLGRRPGGAGASGTDSPLEDREDVYRRAQELMDELRRRAGEAERPEIEREYLRRLLDLF
ncbi:TIGR02302 family protein [Sinisalibacter lacisalsi]|uniref:ATPase n=1 Tax=Sinisalibacter lacisalsi TaxID=1526570 RepID=A0ABQ1QD15_9RHOB|nr:TIGR02302 family protein [Sinisalibacter lacisalsi]GGD23533.1 ATPase [Sinisalibacter lacisalsi]